MNPFAKPIQKNKMKDAKKKVRQQYVVLLHFQCGKGVFPWDRGDKGPIRLFQYQEPEKTKYTNLNKTKKKKKKKTLSFQ